MTQMTPTMNDARLVPPTNAPAGQRIDAREYIAEGTDLWLTMAWLGLIGSGLVLLLLSVVTWGIALIVSLVGVALYFLKLGKSRAALRGSALQVGPEQFPDVYDDAVELSSRLGLPKVPEIYIAEASQPNAAALRLGGQAFVVLYSSAVRGAMESGRRDVVRWLLAHELAHHALGHTGIIRGMLSRNSKSLSRRDEFSCDAVAHVLVGNADSSRDALSMLLVGPELFTSVNAQALEFQVRRVIDDTNSRKAEKNFRMTHPLLLRRIARLSVPMKI